MRKYKLMNNLGLKIIALVFSAFLWLIVVNLDNPVSSSTFTNIPVTIVNDDIITSAGDVYQVLGDQSVSVVVYANRKVRQNLSADDIVATADIKEMDTSTGLVPVKITIPEFSGDYESAEAVPRNLQIQREKSGRKVLSLSVRTEGELRDGYIFGQMTVQPENVTITGPESILEQVDRAVANVDTADIDTYKDTRVSAELILYDSDGNVISQNQLENNLGEDGITVSVEILELKSVPVTVEVSGMPAEGYNFTGCTSEPETVQISGKSDVIDAVDEIMLPSSVINIDGADSPIEKTVNITPYLPEGVSLADENSGNVKITAMIEQDGTRTINFLVSSIMINNLDEDLKVSYEPDAEITMTFSGEQDRLDVLDISNAVSVDLEKYTRPGTYDIPVNVTLPEGITMTSEVTVRITLEEDTENDVENQTDTDTNSSSEQEDTEDSSGQEEQQTE